jgi:hypothetical protein
MKRKRAGRQKKSAKSQHRWWAPAAAEAYLYAVKLTHRIPDEKNPEWKRIEFAWYQLGLIMSDSADPDNPQDFLLQMADQVNEKLMHSGLDFRIYRACWAAHIEVLDRVNPNRKSMPPGPLSEVMRSQTAPHPSYLECRKHFKKLWGYLPRNLKRSIDRLGFILR